MGAEIVWKCPSCRARLVAEQRSLVCTGCDTRYECIGGVPDLRVRGASWVDHEADREAARKLVVDARGKSVEEKIRLVLESKDAFTPAEVQIRLKRILEAPTRLSAEFCGWLKPAVSGSGLFLDLGCGPGMALSAAALGGRRGIGLDVSLVWLVVADAMIRRSGGEPVVAAGMGEAMPLADRSIDGVIALDVIEHVGDQGTCIREIARVLKPGGLTALATPNRFSLSSEPHVHIWGVGWLPRPWQASYVKWRTGKDYNYTTLLSSRALKRLVELSGELKCELLIPPIPTEDMARFSTLKLQVARLYNRLAASRSLRPVFLAVGPFFHALGTRV